MNNVLPMRDIRLQTDVLKPSGSFLSYFSEVDTSLWSEF